MSNSDNNNAKDRIIFEEKIEENGKDDSKENSFDSSEYDKKLEEERLKYLNNPETFARKRDFFSFYAKKGNRKSASLIQQKTSYNPRRINRLNSQIISENKIYKQYNKFELKPRGFGITKIKDKIAFFEKKELENKYKTLNLTPYQQKYYENNELRKFNKELFKIENLKNISVPSSQKVDKVFKVSEEHFSLDSKNDKNDRSKKQKINLNLMVDYSKIINSSKIIQKEKKLDLFMTENYNINNNKKEKKVQFQLKDESNNESSDSDSDSLSSSSKEFSTNLSHEQSISKHNRQKSQICYNDLLIKMSKSPKKADLISNYKEEYNSNKNDKYLVVKNSKNKICLEKPNKLRNGIKKIYSEKVSDKMMLKKLDNAKFKLNQANNNKIIKRQILEMLDNLIIERKHNDLKSEKINNLYDKQKLIRAFEILPQLLLIHQKINILMQKGGNSTEIKYKDNLNEKEIRQSVSSIYFLDCIGLEPIILFNKQNKFGNLKLINDIDENIEISGINNKKKYLKNYFHNLNKGNLLLKILINIINSLRDKINIKTNK